MIRLLAGFALLAAAGPTPKPTEAPAKPADTAKGTEAAPKPVDPAAVEVRERERAFAQTMADRNLEAFTSFLSEEAVFISSKGPLRGKAAVVEGWKRFYEGPQPPFSWEPETVEVIASGGLALSRGPVHGTDGKRIGTFTSTWRREADGQWRIVLDSGCPACTCP
jgi:ketosteroid isomerase-like protein